MSSDSKTAVVYNSELSRNYAGLALGQKKLLKDAVKNLDEIEAVFTKATGGKTAFVLDMPSFIASAVKAEKQDRLANYMFDVLRIVKNRFETWFGNKDFAEAVADAISVFVITCDVDAQGSSDIKMVVDAKTKMCMATSNRGFYEGSLSCYEGKFCDELEKVL